MTDGENNGSDSGRPDKTTYMRPDDPQPNRKLTLYSRGAKGVRIRDERVRRLSRRIMTGFAWLTPADRDLIRAYCQVQILADEAFAKVRVDGLVRPSGQPHPLLGEFRNLIKVQADLAGRLGLSPRDRAIMKSNSTTAALERIDLTRVDRILRARGRGAEPDDASVIEENNGNDDRGDSESGE